jgi:hypothetical protein
MIVLVEWKVHSKTTFFTSVGLPSHNIQIKKMAKPSGRFTIWQRAITIKL